jgi:hypothetical protein
VVVKVREKLSVSKQATQSFGMHRFNVRKLNEMGVIEENHIKISNRSAALENLDGTRNMNRASENTGTTGISKSPVRQSRSVQK